MSEISPEEREMVVVAALNDMFTGHDDHPFMQIGRCVYCVTCDRRLYQGTIPEGHPVAATANPPRPPGAPMLEAFRERWGGGP